MHGFIIFIGALAVAYLILDAVFVWLTWPLLPLVLRRLWAEREPGEGPVQMLRRAARIMRELE